MSEVKTEGTAKGLMRVEMIAVLLVTTTFGLESFAFWKAECSKVGNTRWLAYAKDRRLLLIK